VKGFVRDSAGRPLEGSEIRVVDLVSPIAISDGGGRYALRRLPAGTYRLVARQVGYLPDVVDVTLEAGGSMDIDFLLERPSHSLAAVEVRAASVVPPEYRFTTRYDAFFKNREKAVSGVFLDKADLERYGGPARALTRFSGVKATENMGTLSVAFKRCSGGASPAVLVNGVLAPDGVLATIPITSIELIEVYRSIAEMPIEARGNSCGAIAIYTR
jgi:hypothetical protein